MFEFWILNETTGAVLLLPVTPAGYEISYGMQFETVRATNVGDLNLAGRRKPKAIRLESFFTTKDYRFARYVGTTVNHAMDYVKLISGWIEAKDIIRVIIADKNGPRVNERFYIEDLLTGETYGVVSHGIKEYSDGLDPVDLCEYSLYHHYNIIFDISGATDKL